MNIGASLANTLWLARGRSAARRFALGLAESAATQEQWLMAQLARHAASEFGRRHDFAGIRSAAEFAKRVPLCTYDTLAPEIARIRRGARDVLATGAVTHLAPTSGSTGAQKLIPFTGNLQAGFDAALSPWMGDLVQQRPRLRWGPAYWSVSPQLGDDGPNPTDDERGLGPTDTAPSATNAVPAPPDAVPVGFADDAEYLGGIAARLVRRALAVPAELRLERDPAQFWHRTRLALLRARDLRLISIWHPSFLDLLTTVSAAEWERLLDDLARVGEGARANELRFIGPGEWPRWWPELQVVSCWGEQAAVSGFERIRARLPHVLVQAKGLLATEAVVSIPFGGTTPLAITSHFFEFIDDAGGIRGAHQLERGATYEVVVTNGGGLWRYRLGDVVACTGHLRSTPTLRFLGRAGRGSDLRGEKLTEAFVAGVLGALFGAGETPSYLALRAWDSTDAAGYELLLAPEPEAQSEAALAARLDTALAANPHYALARRLGQLAPPRITPVAADRAAAELAAHTGRLGDAKPALLIPVRERARP
jgi:hypothetical protein